MATYIIRNRTNKAISGCIGVKDVQDLFEQLDHNRNPFDFEFCLSDPNSFWFDETSVWFEFKPMVNFHDTAKLIPVV